MSIDFINYNGDFMKKIVFTFLLLLLSMSFNVQAKSFMPMATDHPCRAEIDQHCKKVTSMKAGLAQKIESKNCLIGLRKNGTEKLSESCLKQLTRFKD